MSYNELANYLHVLSTNIVEHSKLPVSAETIQLANNYKQALEAVYPLLNAELDKIINLQTSPGIRLNIVVIPKTNATPGQDEIQQNRQRLLNSINENKFQVVRVGHIFKTSMPQYQSYYNNQYMKPYERFTFVVPRGDGLYDNYFVVSEIKQNNAKIKEVKVSKRNLLIDKFYTEEETVILTPERIKKGQQAEPSNVFTGWTFKDSNKILMSGVADDEGRLIFDGGKYPDDFPLYTDEWNFAGVEHMARLFDKAQFQFQVINGTRVVYPYTGFRFYSGERNGSYHNYKVTNYRWGATTATVRFIDANDYMEHGPNETITLNVQDIPPKAGYNYTKSTNIYFWTLNGQPLHGGIVTNEGYTLDIYADKPLKYKYLYDRDDNNAPIPVLNLIANVEIYQPNARFSGVYYVSNINDNTITLSKLDRTTDAPATLTATKVHDETIGGNDIPGIVKYRWSVNTPGESYVNFGQYKTGGWSYPT